MKDYANNLSGYVEEQKQDYIDGMITMAEMLQNVLDYVIELKEDYKLELDKVISRNKSEIDRMK